MITTPTSLFVCPECGRTWFSPVFCGDCGRWALPLDHPANTTEPEPTHERTMASCLIVTILVVLYSIGGALGLAHCP